MNDYELHRFIPYHLDLMIIWDALEKFSDRFNEDEWQEICESMANIHDLVNQVNNGELKNEETI